MVKPMRVTRDAMFLSLTLQFGPDYIFSKILYSTTSV